MSRAISTFALLARGAGRGHRLSYYPPDRLALLATGWRTCSASVRDNRAIISRLGEGRRMPLDDFDVILLRQDPPFDLATSQPRIFWSACIPAHCGDDPAMCATRRKDVRQCFAA